MIYAYPTKSPVALLPLCHHYSPPASTHRPQGGISELEAEARLREVVAREAAVQRREEELKRLQIKGLKVSRRGALQPR